MNEQMVPQGAQLVQPQPSVDYNIFIQELTTQTRKFEMYLMGQDEIRNKDGEKEVVVTSKPKMNSEGRKAIMSWIHNYITPNVYLAMNKDHNVENIYKLDNMNVLTLLYSHLNEYEITIEDANDIHSQFCETMMAALQRSKTDKEYIFPRINTNYTPNQPMQEPKKLFGLF